MSKTLQNIRNNVSQGTRHQATKNSDSWEMGAKKDEPWGNPSFTACRNISGQRAAGEAKRNITD